MAKSPTELIRELSLEIRALAERGLAQRDQISDMKVRDEKRQEELDEVRRELALIKQENAALRQQVLDHIAQYQEWDRRRWGLIVMLIGATLSLASGLIATLARK